MFYVTVHHFSKFLKFLIKAGLTSGLGIRSLFSDRIKYFLRKNEQMSDSLKKNVQFAHSLISGEQPKRIAHSCSFLVRDLSDWVTSIIFGERNEQFAHIAL